MGVVLRHRSGRPKRFERDYFHIGIQGRYSNNQRSEGHMMKVYKKESNVFHKVVYGMVIFLTIAIVAVWIYKGVFPVQAIAGYGIVLGYAAMLRGSQTYAELDESELRIINLKDEKSNRSFLLKEIDSISIKRTNVEGYSVEIRTGNRITGVTVSLLGTREKNALMEDLKGKGITVK